MIPLAIVLLLVVGCAVAAVLLLRAQRAARLSAESARKTSTAKLARVRTYLRAYSFRLDVQGGLSVPISSIRVVRPGVVQIEAAYALGQRSLRSILDDAPGRIEVQLLTRDHAIARTFQIDCAGPYSAIEWYPLDLDAERDGCAMERVRLRGVTIGTEDFNLTLRVVKDEVAA